MSLKEIFIFIVGAFFGKVIQDSLPILDVRPGLRRIMGPVLKQLGIILAVLSMLRPKNSIQFITTLMVAIPLVVVITQLMKMQLEKTTK